MKKWLMAVLFGTLLILGACGGAGNKNNTEEPAETEKPAETEAPAETDEGNDESAEDGGAVDTAAAEEAYQRSCASCHGQDLSGGSFPELAKIGSKLSADEIEEIILNGQGSMPPGLLAGEEARNVAEWLAEHK